MIFKYLCTKISSHYCHRLTGFQADVQKSSEKADLALRTVPSIEQEIENAEQLIRQAGEALMGANKNALEAKTNAQQAQEKYAEQASKTFCNFLFR
ncbi:laminin subunit gamma-1-like, partial [Rhagoletis pomonella]|uniref:laminin subunit gamma-1-like n=1 Tax=Rhagoletis pomonella TaxID=28610 RepID=UPI0017805D21